MQIRPDESRFSAPILWITLLVAAMSVGGCQPVEEIDLLKQGEALCLDQQWEEAKAVLKKHLLTHPDDAGAHYYLGRCNVYGVLFWPEVARGEYETALQLFLANGKKNPIERFSAEYFEMICHIHTAEVLVKVVFRLNENGMPLVRLQSMIDDIESSIEQARKVSPDHPDVEGYDGILRKIKEAVAQESKLSKTARTSARERSPQPSE